jgi:hypothetical protein
MSFGVIKEKLVKSLGKVRKSICYYMGDYCDCKYLGDDAEVGSGECSGCPELYQAMSIIDAMTPDEFDTIRKRAKITISELDLYDQKEIVEARQVLESQLTQSEILELKKIVEKVKREKQSKPKRSAYQPGKLPKGIL